MIIIYPIFNTFVYMYNNKKNLNSQPYNKDYLDTDKHGLQRLIFVVKYFYRHMLDVFFTSLFLNIFYIISNFEKK